MDQLGAGERLQSQPWPRESYYSRNALGVQLYLAGESLMKWMVWDTMRGIDVLLERPYMDTKRIVMLGAVAGGGDPAAVTAASTTGSPRSFLLTSAKPVPRTTTLADHAPMTAIPPIPGGASGSPHDVSGSVLQSSSFRGSFALRRRRAALFTPLKSAGPTTWRMSRCGRGIRKCSSLYGRIDHLAQVDGFGPFPGPGEVTHVGEYLRQKIYPILQRWLDVPVPSKEYHNPRPEEDLMCLTPAEAARRRPKTVNEIASSIAQERLSSARARRRNLPAAQRVIELRSAITAKLGDHEPPVSPQAKVLWTKPEQLSRPRAFKSSASPESRCPSF